MATYQYDNAVCNDRFEYVPDAYRMVVSSEERSADRSDPVNPADGSTSPHDGAHPRLYHTVLAKNEDDQASIIGTHLPQEPSYDSACGTE